MEGWMYNKEHILTFGDFEFLSDVLQEGAQTLCSKWQVPPQPLKSPQVPLKGKKKLLNKIQIIHLMQYHSDNIPTQWHAKGAGDKPEMYWAQEELVWEETLRF